MVSYLALIRGINVGGNSLVKMAELQTALEQTGFLNVRTYTQSGNVFFESHESDQLALAEHISRIILDSFGIAAGVVVFNEQQWRRIINQAPAWWGADENWKHNLLIMLPPYHMPEVIEAVGELKPEIEAMEAGDGVLYQSMSRALFGRTTTGKLASNPIYKRMTVRNYNTATKLLELF